MIDGHRPAYTRWLRPVLLALIVGVGLAMAGAARYSPTSFQRFWNPTHGVLLRTAIDPMRNRSHAAFSQLRRGRDLWRAGDENERLRREIATVAASNQLLREEMDRMRRLTALEGWGGPPDIALVPADVVGTNTYEGVLLIINKGKVDGVMPGDPAVSVGGLVGKVRSTSSRSSMVQSLTDPQSVVGAVSVGASGTRARGVVHGRGKDSPLEFFPENEVQPIEPGAIVISSGFNNSIFPKGLVIGVIESKSLDPNGLPYGVVRPAMPVASAEEVLLVMPADRAHGKGLKPTFSEDTVGTFTLMTMQPVTSGTAHVEATSQSQTIQLTMPPSAIREWTTTSTAALDVLLGQSPSTQTLSQWMITTATLAQVHAVANTQTTSTLPIPVSTPKGTPEPPVPPIESFEQRQNLDKGEWPSDWQRGGER